MLDIVFIHCPSYFDFRNVPLITSAFTDGISNSSIYEMYPIGFLTMAGKLQESHFKVQIINLALKMLVHPKIEINNVLKNIKSKIYAFDIHWMIHSFGTVTIAKIVKELHPNAKVLLGGFSASYFSHEIMEKYNFVDFILKGDSIENLIPILLSSIENNRNLKNIPNLVWRCNNKIIHNAFTYIPKEFEENNTNLLFSIAKMMRDSLDFDLAAYFPTLFNFKRIVFPILFSKGCIYNCINCGGSNYAMGKVSNRTCICLKKPEFIVKEILEFTSSFSFPIRIIGDLQIMGKPKYQKVLDLLKKYKNRINSPIYLEFFSPPNFEFVNNVKHIFPSTMVEISPESGNDYVRNMQGRPFNNTQLLNFVENIKKNNVESAIFWFQVGNAYDSKDSLQETIHFSREILKIGQKHVSPFISPLCPYIDPGSIAFENPSQNHYRLLYPSLVSQINGLKSPIWKYYLNYETNYLTRDDIVKNSYQLSIELNKIKEEMGLISNSSMTFQNRILNISHLALKRIDASIQSNNYNYLDDPKLNFLIQKDGLSNLKKDLAKDALSYQNSILDLAKNAIKFGTNFLKQNF